MDRTGQKVIRAVIFDGDNTLWECAKYYVAAQERFGKLQEDATGIPADVCVNILQHIDLESIKLPNAFSRERYPRSFAAGSFALDIMSEQEPNHDRAIAMWHLGNSVFDEAYPLYPGVRETLAQCRDAGYTLAICTKGDHAVQSSKITKNGLEEFFVIDNTWITPYKHPQLLRQIAEELKLPPSEIMVVGDSLRDDIAPALEVGMTAVWVSGQANQSWGYEANHKIVQPDHQLATVTQLATVLPLPETARKEG